MEQNRVCLKCKEVKANTLFPATRYPVGRSPIICNVCKDCRRQYMLSYRKEKKEHIKKYRKEYEIKNSESIKTKQKEYRKNNKEFIAKLNKEWIENNRGLKNAHTGKRKAVELKATPKWLTESDWFRINAKYQLAAMFNAYTGEEWEVDHIFPLQGKEVCGLHVPSNLRVIPWLENVKKGNKLIEDRV